MKQLSLLSLLLLFVLPGIFSQTYLLKEEQHGYDFTNLYKAAGWENRLSLGYTHAGRLHISIGYTAFEGSKIDILTPISHHFSGEVGFAILKQDVNDKPLTINGIAGIRSGNGAVYNETSLHVGIGVYKRFERSDRFSINPGIALVYYGFFSRAFGYGTAELQLSTDFLFGRFKIGPHIALGTWGTNFGVNLGFVLPSLLK